MQCIVPGGTEIIDPFEMTDLVGIINTKLTRLPSTGSIGTIGFTVGGFALMGAGAYIIAKKKRVHKSK